MAVWVFWLLLFGCLGIALLIGVLRFESWRKERIEFSYQPKLALYDRAERVFLGHLVWAVGQHVIIFGKVRLADVITVTPGLSPKLRQEAYDQISRQHIDFLLCDKKTTRVLCAVELYDPAAAPKKTLLRARFIDKVMKQAGIPIARFPRSSQYLSREIESSIRQTLALSGLTWADSPNQPAPNARKVS